MKTTDIHVNLFNTFHLSVQFNSYGVESIAFAFPLEGKQFSVFKMFIRTEVKFH